MLRFRLAIAVLALLAGLPATWVAASTAKHCTPFGLRGAQICIHAESYHEDVCEALRVFADAQGLPRAFFARLIWQESGFNPGALSPKGAQGIAQFMPYTAKRRGLADPYNPAAALQASAAFLADLKREFGNLGLAAAAYNAGEARVRRVVAGSSTAPRETRHYVANITGHSVDAWVANRPGASDYALKPGTAFYEACVSMAKTRKFRGFGPDAAPRQYWGVEIASHDSAQTARRLFEKVRDAHAQLLGGVKASVVRVRNRGMGTARRYSAQVGKLDQGGAISLCRKLRRSGVVCRVVKN